MESETIRIDSGGVSLSGELLHPGSPGAPLVVLCHGIPLSRPDPADGGYPMLAGLIREKGYAVLFVNFRGTGDSGGNFHLGGWYVDLEREMRFVSEELGGRFTRTYLAGFSAGGTLALKYAAEHAGVDGVAAFAAPASFERLFPREHLFAFLELARDVGIIRDTGFPPTPDWFYDELRQFDAMGYISRVSPVPLLLVHGGDDELVPLEDSKSLFEAAGEPKQFSMLPGGMHRLRHDPRALDCLLGWLDRIAAGA